MNDYFTLHNFPFTFVFEPWVVNSALTLGFTCVTVLVIALLFEGIRVLRVWVKRQYHVQPLYPILSKGLVNSTDCGVIMPSNQSYIKSNRIRNHISQTVIHVFRVALGYLLMLAFMTYNVYICIGIVLGATVGYFLFCHELTRWHEPELCDAVQAPSTKSSSATSTPPGEESHPMLETQSAGSSSMKNNGNLNKV